MFSKGAVSKLIVRQRNPGVLMVAHGLDLMNLGTATTGTTGRL